MKSPEKVREDRLRRKLDRMGYRLTKSAARDPDSTTFGGYMIIEPQHNVAVAGQDGNFQRGYSFNLNDVEAWIGERSHVAVGGTEAA